MVSFVTIFVLFLVLEHWATKFCNWLSFLPYAMPAGKRKTLPHHKAPKAIQKPFLKWAGAFRPLVFVLLFPYVLFRIHKEKTPILARIILVLWGSLYFLIGMILIAELS